MSFTLEKAVPVLASLDIPKTTAFWVDRFGFDTLHQDQDYAIMQRDAVQIHFWKCDDKNIPAMTSCRVGVQKIDGLYEEMKSKGAIHPHGGLERKPWGMNEFAVIDGDGNCVTFFEPAR